MISGCWFWNRELKHLLYICIGGWRKFHVVPVWFCCGFVVVKKKVALESSVGPWFSLLGESPHSQRYAHPPTRKIAPVDFPLKIHSPHSIYTDVLILILINVQYLQNITHCWNHSSSDSPHPMNPTPLPAKFPIPSNLPYLPSYSSELKKRYMLRLFWSFGSCFALGERESDDLPLVQGVDEN